MGIHSLNRASMLLDLAEATDDESFRRRAMQTANYVTVYLSLTVGSSWVFNTINGGTAATQA